MSKLHFIASAKGGVGKTLCALSAFSHFDRMAFAPVVAIDLNFQNGDFSAILQYFATSAAGNPLGLTGYQLFEIPGNGGSTHFLVAVDPSGDAYGRLPWEGGLGVYRLLDCLLEEVKKYLVSRKRSPNIPICLVDTNLSIINLSPLAPPSTNPLLLEASKEYGLDNFQNLKQFRPYVWFLWTVAMLSLVQDQSQMMQHLRLLTLTSELNFGTGNEKWLSDEQFIHVINLSAFQDVMSLGRLFWGSRPRIAALESLAAATKGQSFLFDQFIKIATSKLKDAAKREEQLELIARAIGYRETEKRWIRPPNVFPIHIYDKDLVGYTDDFRHRIGAPTIEGYSGQKFSLNLLQEQISSVSNLISKFLEELD